MIAPAETWSRERVEASSPLTDPLPIVRRRYHFHLPGVIYAVTTIFLAIGAINSQNNLLFWAFGLAVAGMLVSGVVSGACLMGIELERGPIAPTHAGEPLTIRYRVRNRNRFMPAFALNVTELPDSPRGFPAADWSGAIKEPFAFVPALRAGESATITGAAVAITRGRYRFVGVSVWTVFPFGLTRKSVTFAGERRAIVRPAIGDAGPHASRGAADAGASSRDAVARAPDGQEYFAVREYTPGDSPRAISWRRSARSDEVIVRQFAAHAAARVRVVLSLNEDADAGERAISSAAGVIDRAIHRGLAVGLDIPSEALRTPARAGGVQRDALLDTLSGISAKQNSNAAPSAPESGPVRGERIVVVRADPPGDGGRA